MGRGPHRYYRRYRRWRARVGRLASQGGHGGLPRLLEGRDVRSHENQAPQGDFSRSQSGISISGPHSTVDSERNPRSTE